MTPDEQLDHLDQELTRLESEHPGAQGILRLTESRLRGCSKWKWEQHGWTLSDGDACGNMNGTERERRTALLSILKTRGIHKVEFVPGEDRLEVVADR